MIKPSFLFILSIVFFFCSSAFAEQVCQVNNLSSTTPLKRFQITEYTVTDTATGLMWRKCQEGVGGDVCDSGAPATMNWANALLYVSRLNMDSDYGGHQDWRLPNIRELSTLVELQCVNPAINRNIFPKAQAVHVWSSSPYHFYTHYSWYVDFANGAPTYDERIAEKGLWLVRDVVINPATP